MSWDDVVEITTNITGCVELSVSVEYAWSAVSYKGKPVPNGGSHNADFCFQVFQSLTNFLLTRLNLKAVPHFDRLELLRWYPVTLNTERRTYSRHVFEFGLFMGFFWGKIWKSMPLWFKRWLYIICHTHAVYAETFHTFCCIIFKYPIITNVVKSGRQKLYL